MPEITLRTPDGTPHRFTLEKERVTIGRSRQSDIFLSDQWLSRHHAEVSLGADGYYLADLGSKNGTLLNGSPLADRQRLRPGDVITLGEHTLTYTEGGTSIDLKEEAEPAGTRIFSARVMSDIKTKPGDPADLVRQNRLLSTLSESAKSLLLHRPLPELYEDVLELVFEAVPAERAAIMLLEGSPPVPTVKASRSRRGDPIQRVSRSIARRVLENLDSVLIPNILDDSALKDQESIMATGVRSAMCAPLWYTSSSGAENAVIGLVYVDCLRGGGSFGEDDVAILSALANIAAAKIENVRLLEESLEKRRLEDDIHVAAEIQTRLLPRSAPQVPGYDLVGSTHPCRAVGGDYFDFEREENDLLFAVGDVSGKGTGAAMLMTMLRASVRGQWNEASVSGAVKRINRTVCQNVPDNKYITFFLGRLDPGSGVVRYVNAGHNPPLLLRAGGAVEQLTEGGMVLGLIETVAYAEGTARLDAGDTLIVYSDGVTETFDPQDAEFGEEGLTALAVRGRGLDAATLQAEILRELDLFAKGAKATDDRTLIIVKRL
jgi:sigma-B regulation protein RsbU (phosphoserine phosphatase)